jgi:predicted TIM-barrel fold metal-dependent hydrolase
MDALRVIDADTHVDETEQTWEYLASGEEALKPTTAYPRNPDPNRPPARYWQVGTHRRPRFIREETSGTKVEARELLDVDVRLRHMDELGIDTQVIYPTLFLSEPAETAEQELAWTRSYNRWLADRCARSHGRLRWVCVPPVRTMERAVAELQFAKDHGACGVLRKGDQEGGKWPADPYFFPLYEEAARLNMPLCFHIGSGAAEFPTPEVFGYGRFQRLSLSPINAVYSLISYEIPQKFPNLRIGAIETGASWVPFIKYDLQRLQERRGDTSTLSGLKFDASGNVFQNNRIYVTCQVDEDLPYIIAQMGDDNLLAGSDYTHNDPSKELGFVTRLRARVDKGEITSETMRKIVFDNPKAFYGL